MLTKMPPTSLILDKIALWAVKLAPIVAEKYGDGRKGGYIYIADQYGNQLLHKKLGDPDLAKMAKYRSFSREKAERLFENTEHQLSWQSRDPDANKWGGAVRLPNGVIVSFSGFPELVDEAFCAAYSVVVGLTDFESASNALVLSSNQELFHGVYSDLHRASDGHTF